MSAQRIVLPRLGETMEEGTISKWCVAVGESFARGDILAEVETDKAIAELPALAAGTLTRIVAEQGATVGVGDLIAEYETAEQ
jgi:pyruvate dehydrogenase E2 component (dihydrolipoamide acetyltransferase)